jgi:2-(1,2-epoxy-1,2-dihydrophenyl)acetyl-CoA isomerase
MEFVTFTIENKIAYIIWNSVENRNALTLQLADEIKQCLAICNKDDSLSGIVLRGNKHFMAGGDIQLLSRAVIERKPELAAQLIDSAHELILDIKRMAIPIIAVVEGACAGYGVSLLSHCDFGIAKKSSVFNLAYGAIGASPDGGASYTLPQKCGHKKAAELLMLSENFSPQDALDFQLVNYVFDDENFEENITNFLQKLTKTYNKTNQRIKQLLCYSETRLTEQLNYEKEAFLLGVIGEDMAHGIESFLNKSKRRNKE